MITYEGHLISKVNLIEVVPQLNEQHHRWQVSLFKLVPAKFQPTVMMHCSAAA